MKGQEQGIIDPVKAAEELNLVRFKRALARRNFLKNVGLAGAGIAAGAIIDGCSTGSTTNADGRSNSSGSAAASTGAPSQTDVLNFALNLEYLEAEFYSVATMGTHLDSSVTGGTSTASGGSQVPFVDTQVSDIAHQIYNDEVAHVKFLRSALGAAAIPEPKINLNALGIGFATEAQFLTLSRALEDTGVSAYAGAATYLSGNNLQAAAQILATEAYHAGNIRLYVVECKITVPSLDSLDLPPTEQQFFPTDSNGLAVKRTTSQVLAIVYANATPGTNSGGFFPSGVNGNINTV